SSDNNFSSVISLSSPLFFLLRLPPLSTLFPYTTLFRSAYLCFEATEKIWEALTHSTHAEEVLEIVDPQELEARQVGGAVRTDFIDRKSTRLNSSHVKISYAVFCLKKKKTEQVTITTQR